MKKATYFSPKLRVYNKLSITNKTAKHNFIWPLSSKLEKVVPNQRKGQNPHYIIGKTSCWVIYHELISHKAKPKKFNRNIIVQTYTQAFRKKKKYTKLKEYRSWGCSWDHQLKGRCCLPTQPTNTQRSPSFCSIQHTETNQKTVKKRIKFNRHNTYLHNGTLWESEGARDYFERLWICSARTPNARRRRGDGWIDMGA